MTRDPGALPKSVVLVGAGKMGGAMLDGWIAAGMAPGAIAVIDPSPSATLVSLCAKDGPRLNPPLAGLSPPEALVLAVKPQLLDEAAPQLAGLAGPGTVIVSIIAGKTIGDIQKRLPGAAAVIRAMPNLPASIGRGASGAAASPGTSAAQRAMATSLLAATGLVEWLDDEDLIDAVTALSGSGPAYVFHLAECMARAGAAAGLPTDVATRLAHATIAGAGELMRQSDLDAATLRQNVTSPGGTTAAALAVLMADPGLDRLIGEAVQAARRRAGELSG